MNTKELVHALCEEYHTNDPFELADSIGITVTYEKLGSVQGFYNQCFRHKFIHINQDSSEEKQRFTCAHELGHAILHPEANSPFLRENTLFSIDKMEVQANRFAVDLLFSDHELQDYIARPITDAARRMGVTIPLAEYRMKSVEPALFHTY